MRIPVQRSRKAIRWVLAFVTMLCLVPSCRKEYKPACAFADPEFTTSMGICLLVAEYFIAHHDWPETTAQLEEQLRMELEKLEMEEELPAEEAENVLNLLEPFTLIELKKRGANLVLHYRFKIDGKKVEHTVTFVPGSSVDEILESAAASGE